jgi:hypothetical protein
MLRLEMKPFSFSFFEKIFQLSLKNEKSKAYYSKIVKLVALKFQHDRYQLEISSIHTLSSYDLFGCGPC